MAPCTCERRNESRTARSTVTGASSKVVATSMDVSCNAKCSISAKSTIPRKPRGAAPSRSCKLTPVQSRWPCFPPIDRPRSSIVKWSRSSSTSYGCIIRDSGGACWLALKLWEQLDLDRFWQERLPTSRQGTKWLEVLKTQVCYQLIDPGSEWRLHRHWYAHSAMRDLLGSAARVLSDDTLYRCLDKLLAHKRAFFSFLRQRWEVLFQARFDILLYDLTSTYFESDPPFAGKRQFGYSRDKRSDCVQVVIALVVTPQGFPLAYEVMPGNTSDKTTLKDFLSKIEAQYGRCDRVWIMDRGIPTEETLEQMRTAEPPVHYLVGTPKGRLSKFERKFLKLPWQTVRPSVDVKLLAQDNELYVLARSHPRTLKERAMRRRRLKKLWRRLHELQQQTLTRDQLLLKLGAAKKEAGARLRFGRYPTPRPRAARHPTDLHLLPCAATSCAPCDVAKAAICCAPTCPTKTPPPCGNTTSASPRSSKHSKNSSTTSPSALSIISSTSASRPTSSSPSSPIACM